MSVDAALSGLKDFQRATMETVYRRLFVDGQKSMLVADEVGLGKTIVAKGLIAMAIRERRRTGENKPFKVTYVCSNQLIADENVGKLNVFPDVNIANTIVRRIAFLAYAPQENDNPYTKTLILNTLTPETSFRISRGLGNQCERAVIYSLLCTEPQMKAHSNGLACLLRGPVKQKIGVFRSAMEKHRHRQLRDGVAEDFLTSIRGMQFNPKDASNAYKFLGLPENRKHSVYEVTHGIAKRLRANNEGLHRHACNQVSRVLRGALIKACLKYVDADLFILDEFQRFRNLIDTESKEEEAEIARHIFDKPRARILLLSATPFKAFTGDIDLLSDDDHFRDFRRVLGFLTQGDAEILNKYEIHRRALYHQLLSLQKGSLNLNSEHREHIEQILRAVICRTERQIVTTDSDAMIRDKWREDPIAFDMCDVRNYIATDQIADAMSLAYKDKQRAIGKPVEYCKSAPHPLSYLDGYALKKLLKEVRRNKGVRMALKKNSDAWLDLRRINRYALNIGTSCGHARLSRLVEESIGTAGAKLLWVPPSLPYYELAGPFKDAAGFSKVLVFSSWVMVPRMIATLLSYEAERLTVGNRATREAHESQVRKYFPPRNKPNYKRHPVPLLTLRAEKKDAEKKDLAMAKSMSNFCCLYPSVTLTAAYDPIRKLKQTTSVEETRQALTARIDGMIKNAGLSQYEHSNGSSDRWYWAAPALLDNADPAHRRRISDWLNDNKFWDESCAFGGPCDDFDKGGKRHHVDMFREAFCNPNLFKLGRIPHDLPDVLADMALGSPSVVALRALLRLFPSKQGRVTKEHLRGAFEIADEFLNLFNKPESICAVRLSTQSNDYDYWRQVLRYCGDGCLQAVMDEYCHLTKGQKASMSATIKHVVSTANITSASINVDSLQTFLKGRPQKMRCHYAVDFGNQKLETEKGQKRATSIRENFNSPFRPFVLATTSIGQEGLDFHQYCRKIMHWNLPSNPIDLEQREGRINRFKGLVIRQEIARKYGTKVLVGDGDNDIWERLFAVADQEQRVRCGKCELVPYWCIDIDGAKIERIIPMYPFSRDRDKLDIILKTLAVYRLAFGQPRQVELIEHLLAKDFTPEEIESIRSNLLIDLSPIKYQKKLG